MGLKFAKVLIEHNGALTDFMNEDHPYSKERLSQNT